MERYTSFEHETEIKLETSISEEVRDAVSVFVENLGARVKTIVQWDVASKKVENETKEKKIRLENDLTMLPQRLQNKIEKLFPKFSATSRFRLRYTQTGNNETWAFEGKNKEPYFDFLLQALKTSLKEKEDKLDFLKKDALSMLQKRHKKKSKKNRDTSLFVLGNQIGVTSREIQMIKEDIALCKLKRDLSASENEYSFALTGASVATLGYESLEAFLEDVSKKGTITGVVHKTRYHLESLACIHEILGEGSGCTEVALDLGITPVNDGKFLTRLELEFDTMDQLDEFFEQLDGVLFSINELFAETGMQFDKKALKKGQRTLSFEQYAEFSEEDARKTPESYFYSLHS